jgi:acetyl esterase/lipase
MDVQFGERISPFIKIEEDSGGAPSAEANAHPGTGALALCHRPVPVRRETRSGSGRLAVARGYMKVAGMRRGLDDRVRAISGAYRSQESGPASMPRRVRKELGPFERKYGPLTGTRLTPKTYLGELPDVFYLHGGGYSSPPGIAHWWLTAELAEKLNTRIHCMLYPLIPNSTAIETVQTVVDGYLAALDELGEPPIVAGDSSGGGLALALTLTLKDIGAPLPAHLILFAPWIDLTASTPGFEYCESKDPLLALEGIDLASEIYAGALDRANPIVSPIFGDPTGLCPTTVILGTNDALYAEGNAWVDKAEQAGVDVGLFTAKGGFHVFPAAYWLPESKDAYGYIKQRLTR